MLLEQDYQWICRTLSLPRDAIISAGRNPHSGMNNDTYVIDTTKGELLYRIAGKGTERFCSRIREKHAYECLAGLGLTDELLGCDPTTGAKLTIYYPESRTCDPHSSEDCRHAMKLLWRYHHSHVRLDGWDDPYQRLNDYVRIAREAGSPLERDPDFISACSGVEQLRKELACAPEESCPVHADALAGNFLFKPNGGVILIDLEFAAMGSFYGDLADFCHDAFLDADACMEVLQMYFNRPPSTLEKRKFYAYCACVSLMWSAWAAYKACIERPKSAFYEDYRSRSVDYSLNSLKLYAQFL